MDSLTTVLSPWSATVAVLALCLLVRYLYRNVLLLLLRRLTQATPFLYDDELLAAFEQPVNVIIIVVGLYAAIRVSPLPWLNRAAAVDSVMRSMVAFSFFWGCYNISGSTHSLVTEGLARLGIRTEKSIADICSTILRIIIVLFGFVTIAKEWNYDISGFVASLGIGSLAIAFAAKDALANVFGSLVIILDKPFTVGDWIAANGIEGTVEAISFRSTCLRTLPQELVYIPNSLMSNTPITNYTRRDKRRLDFTLGLTYDTTHAQMEHFVAAVRSYLDGCEEVIHTDSVSVNFAAYGESSLDVRIICNAKARTQAEYLQISETINLALMRIMEECGVCCAFPSTSVYFATPLPGAQPKA